MSNATASLPAAQLPGLFRFTREQYYRMGELGFFDGHRVERLMGVIWEQHHGDPLDTSSRPFRFTREQYHQLGDLGFFEGHRVERLNGEIHEMSPKNWPHVVGCRKSADLMESLFAGIGWVARQEPVSLVAGDPEPDVAVISGRFEDYSNHPQTALLIIEVADSSLRTDKTDKAKQYAAANILDYWVLDVSGREMTVFRNPSLNAAGEGEYGDRQVFGPNDSVSPLALPGASVKVADLLP